MASQPGISPLMAVARTPVPTGLVRISWSPGSTPRLEANRPGSTTPDTARPYFISASSTLCPPLGTAPASSTASLPPRSTSASTAMGSLDAGKQTMFMAAHGSPPMA